MRLLDTQHLWIAGGGFQEAQHGRVKILVRVMQQKVARTNHLENRDGILRIEPARFVPPRRARRSS